MLKQRRLAACAIVVAAGLGFGHGRVAAAEKKADQAKKHKIVYHFNDADPKKASSVLTNMRPYEALRPVVIAGLG